eukprot:PITA_05924
MKPSILIEYIEPSPIQIDSSQAAKGDLMQQQQQHFHFLEQTVIMRQGSEGFGPVSFSLIGLQSNQMLISPTNQLGIHKNPVPTIHPAEFSREIYDMGSTQQNNVNFSANLNAPGAKTAMPTKKSGTVSLDERCPTEDSLWCPGGNGEAISHYRSISASEEAEDQHVIDVRKQRRMLSNREAARRSRLRKQHHMDEMRAQVAHLRAEKEQMLRKINITSQHLSQIAEENCLLRSDALELNHKLQRLHDAINVQSHGSFETVDTETANCSAAI